MPTARADCFGGECLEGGWRLQEDSSQKLDVAECGNVLLGRREGGDTVCRTERETETDKMNSKDDPHTHQ